MASQWNLADGVYHREKLNSGPDLPLSASTDVRRVRIATAENRTRAPRVRHDACGRASSASRDRDV